MTRPFTEGTKEEIVAHFQLVLEEKNVIIEDLKRLRSAQVHREDTQVKCLEKEIGRLHNLLIKALCFTEYPKNEY